MVDLHRTLFAARLQRKRGEAHDLLAPICDWFTEGLDPPHLQDAQALLEGLA
jgi:predicted ATPase